MPRVILAMTTSTDRGGVAVLGDAWVWTHEYPGKHAENLLPALDQLLKDARCTRADIDAVACDIGPGSFTGVRVGVACAKGIALALSVPLVGVTSLQAMAFAAFCLEVEKAEVALPLLDAKRGEVFAAAYDAEGNEVLAPLHVPVAEAGSLAARIPGRRVVPVGAAARALGLAPPEDPDIVCRSELPDALAIAQVASLRSLMGGGDPGARAAFDPARVEPLYVRAPDAKPAGVVL
jgi:tRNA threonylcarbamoyladenosine biosynthesis protein TsaB